MDKCQYLRLLSEASINDTSKFRPVSLERPKTKGRPPTYYHPLLEKEKGIDSLFSRILPKPIADSLRPKGSRLAHLYGLLKTHKERLAMRPILSATQTYNYALAKWLEDKLRPLSYNQYTVPDTFQFVDQLQGLKINNGELLVSYDVTSLFSNVPLDETIQILADKAFADDWFNKNTKLNLTKADLVDLLKAATKNQLFQFDGSLYEQIDGVAMPDRVTADRFLRTLNHCHSSVKFTMETERDGSLPFLGVELLNRASKIETKVYIKPTNTGLLLHYHSHVDDRYKRSLINTMLDRAYRLSSDWSHFHEECDRLREVFSRLKYPQHLIDTAIKKVIDTKVPDPQPYPSSQEKVKTARVILPFKDQS